MILVILIGLFVAALFVWLMIIGIAGLVKVIKDIIKGVRDAKNAGGES